MRPSLRVHYKAIPFGQIHPGDATSISPRTTVTPVLHSTALQWSEHTGRPTTKQKQICSVPVKSSPLTVPTSSQDVRQLRGVRRLRGRHPRLGAGDADRRRPRLPHPLLLLLQVQLGAVPRRPLPAGERGARVRAGRRQAVPAARQKGQGRQAAATTRLAG